MTKYRRIRDSNANKSSRMVVENTPDYNGSSIIFSLERVQSGEYCFSKLSKDDKAAFADAIYKRRELPWDIIYKADRHKLGCEKISTASITAPIPRFLTEDQTTLLALRYNDMKAVVGYRIKNIFFALWFDSSFDLYSHD